jgi:hypothetical protein
VAVDGAAGAAAIQASSRAAAPAAWSHPADGLIAGWTCLAHWLAGCQRLELSRMPKALDLA